MDCTCYSNNKLILSLLRQLKYISRVMGNNIAIEHHSELILDFNLLLLIGCKITAIYLFVKLTTYLNYLQKLPIITPAQAIKQRNTLVLVKTKSVFSKQQAAAQIQVALRNIKHETDVKKQTSLIVKSILKRKYLNEREARLYYHANNVFEKQASLNRFWLFRLVFADCNIPKLYPFTNNNQSSSCASSVFLSHNMVSLCKANSNGNINPVYTGFSRQFIKKIIRRQRQIVLVELFLTWGMLLLHVNQISKFYHFIRKKSIQLYRRLLGKTKRRIEIHKEEACIICYARPRNVIFRECKHFIMCDECLNDTDNRMMACPFCRRQGNHKHIRVRFQQ